VALVVGDVAGHGLGAASSMNQLRNGLRSLLVAHDGAAGPALEALDRLAKQLLPGEMATLWAGVLDTVTGAGDYVSAGHFAPPLVRDGEARFEKAVRNPPLGFLRGRPEVGTLTLAPGGVAAGVQRRTGRAAAGGHHAPPRGAADHRRGHLDLEALEHRMTGLESDDDATMLLVTAPQ